MFRTSSCPADGELYPISGHFEGGDMFLATDESGRIFGLVESFKCIDFSEGAEALENLILGAKAGDR